MTGDSYSVVGTLDGVEHVVAKSVGFQEAIEVSVDKSNSFDNINIVEEYELIFRHDTIFVLPNCDMLLKETRKMLRRKSKMDEQAVLLGNFIGPHEGFFKFMKYLIQQKKEKGKYLVFVKGKNEHNLMEYINQTKQYIGLEDDVVKLIQAIEDDLGYSLLLLENKHPEIYKIINEALPYYENSQYILTSGGIDLSTSKWRETAPENLYETQNDFLKAKNNTGKTIVFGGIPVSSLHENGSVRPWFDSGNKKICLDGNCRKDGKLLSAIFTEDDSYFLSVRKDKPEKNYYGYY